MKIGYTSGVFDLFHVGHLNLLRAASARCDFLFVGVTTDELSVERKGKKPIIPLRDRMEIVRSLQFVGAVVIQRSMHKLENWNILGYHEMYVGDDHRGSAAWTEIEKDMASVGVSIVYLPYTLGISSSILRGSLT
jgi:glycerol-3-phosphate cytidylyltransferase